MRSGDVDQQRLPGHGPLRRRPARPSREELARAGRRAWMVTFTDLIGLLLAFFVLLFSMSSMERTEWASVSESLARGLDHLVGEDREAMTLQLSAKPAAEPLGSDIAYLEPLLRQQLVEDAATAEVRLLRDGDQLLLVAPALFAPAAGSEPGLARLAKILASLPNRIEALGFAPAAQDWSPALERSEALAERLRRAGFRDPLAIRARLLPQDLAGDGAGGETPLAGVAIGKAGREAGHDQQ